MSHCIQYNVVVIIIIIIIIIVIIIIIIIITTSCELLITDFGCLPKLVGGDTGH